MRQQLAQLGGGAHALAIQILGNADDAADAVHDAFATALAKPAAFDDTRGPLRPWFLTVVRNRCSHGVSCIAVVHSVSPTEGYHTDILPTFNGSKKLLP